ncbi:hypothetical protein PBI_MALAGASYROSE_34 [Mycobacterium phage MalagasyRose]|uniref:Uncharacterized protein n=1 Tax=Mycobacterium phage MalagasyRose TaxID=2599870 RepID=A0A5J6TEW6_9CAUD|nr:hypothetical protein QEH39_gp54 [Mycobacterium phage MalagasyRose]QFG08884.1 hypothetical protein PBI_MALAGASYROSE_34 [Mycobacterium phage MalagasyRose]
MSLADHLKPKASQCRTCAWYEGLPPDEREVFDSHVAEGGSMRALYRASIAEGLSVARSSFNEHMKLHHEIGVACVAS